MVAKRAASAYLRRTMGLFDWFKGNKSAAAGPQPADWQIAAQWAARARWISHVSEILGDPTDEFEPAAGMKLPYRPEFLVLEFSPREERPHFTYLTAGLSLWPQAPSGPTPHLEVVAYSDRRDPRIAQVLFMLAHDIASAAASDEAFKPLDLWGAEVFGLRDFILVPAREHPELFDFPNLAKRQEDERYLLAATGDLRGEMKLTVVQLVPLSADEWEVARTQGSAALLESLKLQEVSKAYGWSALRADTTSA